MEFSKKQVSTILEALRASPRGLNVSEAARVTGLNRSTVSKYLEMLYVSGQADMRTFGTSKLYYISQRMPISAFLNMTSDLVIVLDKDSRVLNANEAFFEFTGTQREDIVHKYFDNFAFPLKFNPSIMPYITRAIDGREDSIESYYPKKESGHYFNIKLIPMLFDDGDKGVTIIFVDVTEKKLAEKALLNANFDLEKKVKERTKELEKANEALRKSEAYLRDAGQIAHLGYWSYDLRTKESNASDEAIRLFGFGQDTRWSPELFRSMVHPEDILKVEKSDKEAMSRDMLIDYEYRIILPGGSERFIHSLKGTRRNEAGEVVELFGTIQDITGQKRMEIALKESEERYRSLTEKSYDVVYSVKPDGTITYISPQIAHYGYDSEKLLNKNFFEFIPNAYKGLLAEKFRDATVTGIAPPLEFKLFGKDGREYWAEVAGKTVYDEERRPLFQVGTVRNIDERKRAEEALRNSELRFKTLFEGASMAVFIIDLGTRAITDCNEYAARLVGRNKEELIGMHHSKLHSPESAEPCRHNARIHSKDGKAMNYETELVHKDGHRIPILINSTIMEVDGKKFMIGSYLDITERKLAEEALKDSEEKFRALADFSMIGILLIQGEDTIYANQALADMFGYTVDECLKIKYWDPATPEMKEFIRQRGILRQRGEPGPSRNELKMVKKNGESIWLDCTASMLQFKGKPAMMLTAMDITEHKQVESELRKSEERYRILFEKKHDLVWETDENNLCTYMSPRAKDIVGYEQEEIIGRTPFDYMPPEEVMRVMQQIKPLLDEHKPFDILDYYMIKKDGGRAYFNTYAMPSFDDKGQLKGYRGVCRYIGDGTNGR